MSVLHLPGLQLYRANLSQAVHDSLPPAAQIDFDDAAVTLILAAAAASDENGTPHPALSLKSVHINFFPTPALTPDSREETHAKKIEQA